MEEMMGALFYRKQPMSEILASDYDEMKYFFEWHKAITKAEVNAANERRSGRK
jgi:hypothetical protein